jgi:glycosyltransferase involved in cell wall biosynthesis
MSATLRILFVTGEYPPMQGGVADYTRELGRTLVELGHDVGVLTSVDATKGWVEPGIEVFPSIDGWGWDVWSELDRAVADWQPDVVHIQYQTAAFGMHPAINLYPRRRSVKWPNTASAVTFHDLLVPYLFPKAHWFGLRRRVTHTLAKSVDLAITTNPEDTLALQSVRSDLVEIPIGSNIPCAPPPDFERATTRQVLGIPINAPLLCYFGFLNASKGGEMLVDVLANLVEQGYDGHLLMIGGRVGASDPTNFAYLQQVEARIEQLGLTSRLHWTGHVPAPQVSAVFLASDLCLLPYQDGASYRRGSFMAALEHGMAIVSTPPQVPYPNLVDGETLLLAPPDDVEAQTAACIRILSDAELRSRLGENAQALSQQFSWQSIAKQHLQSYSLIERSL